MFSLYRASFPVNKVPLLTPDSVTMSMQPSSWKSFARGWQPRMISPASSSPSLSLTEIDFNRQHQIKKCEKHEICFTDFSRAHGWDCKTNQNLNNLLLLVHLKFENLFGIQYFCSLNGLHFLSFFNLGCSKTPLKDDSNKT